MTYWSFRVVKAVTLAERLSEVQAQLILIDRTALVKDSLRFFRSVPGEQDPILISRTVFQHAPVFPQFGGAGDRFEQLKCFGLPAVLFEESDATPGQLAGQLPGFAVFLVL